VRCGREDEQFTVLLSHEEKHKKRPTSLQLPLLQDFITPPKHKQEFQELARFEIEGWFPRSERGASRPYATLPVRLEENSDRVYPVSFLVDTGAPESYLSLETIYKLGIKARRSEEGSNPIEKTVILIADVLVPVKESREPFTEINLLGTDVLYQKVLHMDRLRNILQITPSIL